MKYLDELRALKLPSDKFAVFGSGPLAIRGLRENRDIDIIVRRNLWEELLIKHKSDEVSIKIGNIEVWKEWPPSFDDIDPLIDDADIIEGIRFVKLENVLKWKRAAGREKDRADIRLIENYLNSGKK